MQKRFNLNLVMTILITVLAIISTLIGLFTNSYRDNEFVKTAFQANDAVTLLLLVPLLLTSFAYSFKSERAKLLWQGALLCIVYNYIFYLYGAAFNRLFLLYVLLIVLSGYTMIVNLAKTDANAVAAMFNERTPARLVSGYMFFFALFLGGVEVAMSLAFVFNGIIPETIIKTGHPTAVVFATDLSVVVSGLIVGGKYLWQRKPWGFILSSIVLVKASTYGLGLVATTLFVYYKLGDMDTLLPLWIALTVGSIISAALLLFNCRRS